jgi:RNA polymerase sigma factor (TIGR02999 family)
MSSSTVEITALLKAWSSGDDRALERLTPLVYEHLRVLGRRYARREPPDARPGATSLVHDAFIRFVEARSVNWQDRAHFFAVAAKIMRRILVDAARARAATKRGGHMQRVDHSSAIDFDRLPAPATDRADEIRRLDDALTALAQKDPRRAQVVELKFFAGLSVEETAQILRVSPQTVMRDWKLARAWLGVELRE